MKSQILNGKQDLLSLLVLPMWTLMQDLHGRRKKVLMGRGNIQVSTDMFCYSISIPHVIKFSVSGTLANQQHKQ